MICSLQRDGAAYTHHSSPPPLQIRQLNPDAHCLQLRALLARERTGEHQGRHHPGCPPRVSTACLRARAELGGLPEAGGRRPRNFLCSRRELRPHRDLLGPPHKGGRDGPRATPGGSTLHVAFRPGHEAPVSERASSFPGPQRAGSAGTAEMWVGTPVRGGEGNWRRTGGAGVSRQACHDLCLCEGSPHPFLVYKHWARRPRDGKSPQGKKKKKKKSQHCGTV